MLPEGRSTPYSYARFKIGDGVTFVEGLPFAIEYLEEKIPTKISELINDSNFATEDIVASTLAEAKTYTDNELATFDFIKVIEGLPETGLPNKIYLVPKADSQTQDLFDEYIWVNNAWEFITTKQLQVDLTNYVEKEAGKGLSTNDYTTEEKNKLAGLNNYTLPAAGTDLGGMKSGGDLVIADGVATVNGLDDKAIIAESTINSEVAYVKDVSSDSVPYAKINKIGGMTRKCTNLTTAQAVYEGADRYAEMVVDGRNCIRFTSGINIKKTPITFKPNTSYTISFYAKSENYGGANTDNHGFTFFYSDGTFSRIPIWQNATTWQLYTLTSESGKTVTHIGVSVSEYKAYVYLDVDTFMLNEGSTALPYEPYFDGLRSAPVTEVESVGANLIPYPYRNTSTTINGITYTDNGDGTITANGTATEQAYLVIYKGTFPIGTYFMRGCTKYLFGVSIYFSNGNYSFYKTDTGYGVTFTTTTVEEITIALNIAKGTTVDNFVFKPMINKGSTALPYVPYREPVSLLIPEAVRPKHGINENVYDYIDFEKKQFVQRVGVVDMGTLSWGLYNDLYQCDLTGLKYAGYFEMPNMLCSAFTTISARGSADFGSAADKSITVNFTMPRVYVKDTTYIDVATFKSAMSGVMLYYELAEPIVTDISDILPADNLIAVEGGGMLTFKNKFGYDVPSEVTFYKGSNDIIGADTFVGDLAGTAARAISDKNGNDIAETYAKKTDVPTKVSELDNDAEYITADALSGLGGGDMLKATYDKDNDGVVDKADKSTQLISTNLGSSAGTTNMIKSIYKWTISAAYGGCTGLYTICDGESQFNGILSLRFRNAETATKLGGHELAWIAASRTPPKAVLTYTINESSITYRLYLYYTGAWRTYNISKITEIGTASTLVNTTVTELVGTTLQEATQVSVNYATTANKATSAIKLETARTIALQDGVTGTATSFNGTANISIPVTSVKEAYLGWGGKDIAGSFSAFDAALISDLGANRLAGIAADRVVCERSSDAGSTWTAYTPSGGTRAIVTTSGNACNANVVGSQSVNNWHRITINVDGAVYCELRKIAILFSSSGAAGTQCKLEWGDYSATTVWTPVKTVDIAGWSGWNIINVAQIIGSSSYGKVKYVRLTFSQTGVNSSYDSNSIVMKVQFYSSNYWGAASILAKTGHLYDYDTALNAIFPAQLTATAFNGSLNGNADTATSAENAKQISYRAIDAAPTGDGTYPVTITTAFTIGNVTFPAYAKGMFVGTPTDATLYVIDLDGTAYTAFRSGSTWKNAKVVIDSSNIGSQSVNYATTATKATQDASGNVITTTYATKTELNGKAPSGYGFGEDANVLVSDIDNITKTGFYQFMTSVFDNTATNYYLIHQIHTAGYACQTAIKVINPNVVYQRIKEGGVWRDWTYYITAGNIGSQSVNYANSAGSANKANAADNLTWYNSPQSGSVTSLGAALSTEHSANRIAYLHPDAISVETSNDGGSTWAAASIANDTKINLVTTSGSIAVGSTTPVTTNHRTRITLTAQNGTTSYLYTRVRKLLINVSSANHGMTVTVEIKTGASGAAWATIGTYTVNGWTGWNDISFSGFGFGGAVSQTSNIWYMRLTFANTTVNSSYSNTRSAVIGLRLFGENCWTPTSNLGNTGHLYSYDSAQNANFPAKVSSAGKELATQEYVGSQIASAITTALNTAV